jgi:hypothetical protein
LEAGLVKKNRKIYLLSVVIAVIAIYFFDGRKYLTQPRNDTSSIQSERKTEVNFSAAHKVLNKTSHPQITSDKASSKSMTLQEAYCQLKKLNLKIPLSKNSKFSGYFGPELLPSKNGDLHTGEPIITMAILDNKCPKNKYSIVKARRKNGVWLLEKSLNCGRASDEELFSEYGLQFTLSEADRTDPTSFNFAMNGPGLFITSCRQGLVLTRHGKYKLNNNGQVENSKGCLLLNRSLKPITIIPGDELSEQAPYCFSEPKQCLAILNRDDLSKLKGKLIAPFEFLVRTRDQSLLQKTLKDPDHFPSEVFSHYTENLTSKDILPSGLSTKSFDSFKEDFECSQGL